MLQADDQMIVLEFDAIAADPELGLDEAASGDDVEVPFVPWTSEQARLRASYRDAVIEGDSPYHAAGRGERRAAMRAAVGDRAELVADPIQADGVAA